jgi:hypothetical protein
VGHSGSGYRRGRVFGPKNRIFPIGRLIAASMPLHATPATPFKKACHMLLFRPGQKGLGRNGARGYMYNRNYAGKDEGR